MMIDIFVVLLIITALLVILGSYFKIHALTLVGLAFMFILGANMLGSYAGITSGIDYKTGLLVNDTGSIINVEYQYTTYSNTTFGVFLCSASMLWFMIIMFQLREAKKEDY